jgi:hypothetical protein|tara:strand:- start:653 stop:1177 length:525 start_codon:yes stop_codon:yes gene_type:complete
MNECKKCGIEMDTHRIHLGYTECIECSETEKYSAHQVYPHKTGGYVQPVKSDTKKNLQRMDRRSTGSGRVAKGIVSDKSWDRWLKQYEESKNNPKPKRKVVWKTPTVNYLSMSESESMVKQYYNDWGYQPTLDYCKELYLDDKISMVMKNQLTNMITDQQMLPKRLRKWVQKIN